VRAHDSSARRRFPGKLRGGGGRARRWIIDISLGSTDRGDWTVVDVAGEVDVFTAPKLREHIIDLVGQGKTRIVVNLERVEFMDSTGLGVLVGGLKRIKEQDGALALAAPTPPVMRLLTITGLTQVFAVHETVDTALR
jgi:anti-sigma B factor antagonist